jgi:hypothetical protein
MQEFKIGQTYELETIEIRQDDRSGKDYIALRDDSCDTYRVYNILKFQYDDLPETIKVIVKDLDVMGRPKLKQDVGEEYKKIYKFGETYEFKITDIKQDICSPTKAEYYELEDDWCVHRYYFKEQLYDIGETCTMLVEGLTRNGDLSIKEIKKEKATCVTASTPVSEDSTRVTDFGNLPVLDLGEESTTLEYKTSIVFRDGEAKIDEQLFVIVKTLVAFMNAQGGDLYIGIHDKTRKVVGISADLGHLNEGEDEYNGQYEPTIDKYQLKIRHALERLSQGVAEELIEFEFPEHQGVQYCHIKVKQAKRPVWVKKNLLFQRTGNRITLLEKDDISNFVYNRMRILFKEIIDLEGIDEAAMTPEKIAEVVRLVNNAHRKSVAAPQTTQDTSKVDYYLVWYQDGTWKKVNDASAEQNTFCVIPVHKADANGLLVFCYNSGFVNEVLFTKFRSGSKLNKLQKDGFCAKEKPAHIFLVNPNYFLAVYSSDQHGSEHVKIHRITDVNPTGAAKNQGSLIIPRGEKIQSFKIVPGEFESKVASLIYPKNKTSNEHGVHIDSPACSDAIAFLNSLP